MTEAPIAPPLSRWWTHWFRSTAVVAVVATVMDAVLLQRKWNYFTGGFLALDHLTNWRQTFGFFAGSLLANAAVVAPITAVSLRLLRHLRLRVWMVVILTVSAGLGPLVVADFISYSILSFLGDTVDLKLMFDLSGRSLTELLAVSDSHLDRGRWIGVAATAAGVVMGWAAIRKFANRSKPPRSFALEPPSWIAVISAAATLLVVGSVSMVALRQASDVIDDGLRREPSVQLLSLGVSRLSDVDRDGYGLLGRISDPAPFDARIYPYALDVPGNGIDEDGVGGDLPAETPAYVEAPPATGPWGQTPNVILIMLESVRADYVGSSVAGQPVTPVLDGLARSGVEAGSAYSHNGYTVQSRQHVFSGSLAGIRGRTTLIDDFKAHGYQVAYFSGQDESFGGADGEIGFARADVAFDARSDIARRYSASVTPGSLAIPYNVVLERVQTFLDKRSDEKPLFLYVNFHDTHFPYHHGSIEPILHTPVLQQGEIEPERAPELRQMYANTLANVDRAIGRLLKQATAALGTPPAVIVLSDHGESLFDEGFLGHGYDLTDAQTRIPFIISNLAVRMEEPFGEADLRDALLATLARPRNERERPAIVPRPDREVFQYLGVIDDPAQIGLRRLNERIAYDFRTRRVRLNAAPWIYPEALSPADLPGFLRLVRMWERMRLAKSAVTPLQPDSRRRPD